MAIYEYQCDADGAFDVIHPIGAAPSSVACPVCTSEARRVFSAPLLATTPRAVFAALDHSEKTRTDPDVVSSLPPRAARKRTPVLPLTPTLRRLPRP